MAQDIADTSFWHKIPVLRQYALLARWDRPIGFWLLYWPCVWGIALSAGFQGMNFQSRVAILGLFLIGAIAMRGAGCTLNDLYDRKLDAQVARTRTRPLASGAVKPWQAVIFLILQLAVGGWVLWQLPRLSIIIGLCTLPVIALYPLMKRVVWWPQFVLATVFASGALVGWAATENAVGWPAVLLYGAGMLWVVGYDTVYAHMDMRDDSLIGVRSTALWWHVNAKRVVGWLWLAMGLLFLGALMLTAAAFLSYLMLGLAMMVQFTAHLFWKPENPQFALVFFRMQNQVGLVLALAALAPAIF